jgi:hypothetical protein
MKVFIATMGLKPLLSPDNNNNNNKMKNTSSASIMSARLKTKLKIQSKAVEVLH